MSKRWWTLWLASAPLALSACDRAADMEGLVAQAGEHRLTVDRAVDLLVDEEQFPAQADVVRALADLWIDYVLFGQAVARDSTLSSLDFEPVVRLQMEQTMVFQLRDSVIQVDTAISEDELRELYEAEAPDAQMRARHILLTYPQGATQAQRDSVRARIEALRSRVQAGESFEALARQFSQDRGTATQGGDLGYFGRGEMVRPIEDAVFALSPGEVSEPVESPYGLHLVRLDERRVRSFDEVRGQFRVRVQNLRNQEAESTYVANLVERADPTVEDGAPAVVREIAREPGSRISGRALRRPLVSYDGGAVTVGHVRRVFQSQSGQYRQQVQQATDAQLEDLLRGILRRQLLVEEAEASGLGPSPETVDDAVEQARSELLTVARDLGFTRLDVAPGEPRSRAVARAVDAALADVLAGAADVVPLGPIAFQLRERAATAIYDRGVGEVVLRVGQIRASRGLSPLENAVDSALATPDTAGG